MIPADIEKLMQRQQCDVARKDVRAVRSRLTALGVLPGTEFFEFFVKYCAFGIRSQVSTEELMDPSYPTAQMEGTTTFVRETYDVTDDFVCLTSGEGEGFYLFELPTGRVYDLGVEDLTALESGGLAPRWGSFFEFIAWYVGGTVLVHRLHDE